MRTCSYATVAVMFVCGSGFFLACDSSGDEGEPSNPVNIPGVVSPEAARETFTRAQAQMASVVLADIHRSLQMYRVVNDDRLPESLEELSQSGSGIMDEVPLDPWNQHYGYERMGEGRFRIYSLGPDGRLGTEDDIEGPH